MSRSRIISILLFLAITGYILFFTAQLFLHYQTFGSRSMDLGNMDQAIWNTLHGRLFHQTNQPGVTNRLSLHVEPILIPVSLLYLVYSGPETLFVFETIIVALGAIPVYALARLKLKNEGLALIFGLVYLMYPPLQAANLLEFHAVTMAPTFLLAAFYFLETKRPLRFAIFAVLAAACKEEIALIVMLMGFYALFFKHQRRLGLITITASIGWTILAVFVIPPLFARTQNIHWGRYDHLGKNGFDIVANFFIQPDIFLKQLQEVNALNYLFLLLAPTAFTALFSPVTLLLALPSLGINLLSNFPPMQEVNRLMYAAPIIPAIFISSIIGSTVIIRIFRGKFRVPCPIVNLIIGVLILTASLIYHTQYGYFPGGGQFRIWPRITAHHRNAVQIFAQIPPDGALAAHDRLNPHVSQRETLHIFDGTAEGVDYIVLDVTADSWPLHPVELRHRVEEFLKDGFGIIDAYDGYLLLAKNQPDLPSKLPDTFFEFARVNDPHSFSPQHSTPVTFDNKIKLLGYDISLGAHYRALPVLTLYWQALEPLADNYVLWPFFMDRNGHLLEDTTERPLVTTVWYPTSRWSTNEIIRTSTLPYELGDEFVVGLGITTRNWSDASQRLPISHADESLYTYEHNTWVRLGTLRRNGGKSYEAITYPSLSQPQKSISAQFWHSINLTGVDLPTASLKPGEELPLTLYWLTTAPLPIDLTTFVHLLDQEGNIVSQLDWTPQDSLGYLPTMVWQPQRLVIDNQKMTLPDDLAPGEYRLVVGWYYPLTGDRLPVTLGGTGNVVDLGTVSIR